MLPTNTWSAPSTTNPGESSGSFRSYSDGIFFTDPVKLVVRDADDRAVTETDYGRDLAIVCAPRSSCLVFRYADVAPILPTDIWRLENGQLRRVRSKGSTAVGIVAPVWTHAGGYLTAFMFLVVPAAMALALWRIAGERGRSAIAIAFVVVGLHYLGVWLYVVVLLSYLSLPWTFVTSLSLTGLAYAVRRLALGMGLSESRWRLLAQFVVMGMAVVFVLTVVLLGVIGAYLTWYSAGISFDEPAVQAPLSKGTVTRDRGTASEIFVTLGRGVKLEDAVNLRLFDGFIPRMTREQAEERLGPASGRGEDPWWRVPASHYDRPDGRVTLVLQGVSTWTTVGYPTWCTHDYVFKDARVLHQVLQWLPPTEARSTSCARSAVAA